MATLLAAFALLLARPARADQAPPAPKLKPCVFHTAKGWKEPPTLQELIDCQTKRRQEWTAQYRLGRDAGPPAGLLDAMDDAQRAEAGDYASRHPDRAQTRPAARPVADEDDDSPPPALDAKRAAKCRPPGAVAAAPDANAAAQQKRTAAAMRADEKQVDPGTGADLDALNTALLASSQNGDKGITADGARSIVDYLQCEQGGASPDMQRLLDQLSRDGAKLSDRSMVELKQAARSAKDAGLDLGVDSKLEGWLLDPTTDPQQPAPGAL